MTDAVNASVFFKDILKTLKDEDTNLADEGAGSGEFTGFINTGAYALNALLSGSIYDGMPNNKRTMFAGESSTGKCARGTETIRVYSDASTIRRIAIWLDENKEEKYAYKWEETFDVRSIDLTYRELYEFVVGSGGIDDKPYPVDLDLSVKTPDGSYAPIQEVIRKKPTEVLRIETTNGRYFECSVNHLFSHEGKAVAAKNAVVIDTVSGPDLVEAKHKLGVEHVYDIQIPDPHWYVSPNGIIHHNTFFALSIVKELLDADPRSGVVYYDSESAINKQMLVERGIDPTRVIIVDIDTVQKLRTHILRFVRAYTAQPEKTRPQMAIVIDSLGNLSTSKEMEDIEAGKDTRDMTRAQLLRGLGRSITVPLARAKIPLIVNNHTYTTMGLFPTQELSGGGGVRYIADGIVFLSKAQDKSSTGEHKGIIITARNFKSRLTREKSVVKLKLSFTTGLDKYYGLLEIAERAGLVTKMSTKYKLPNGLEAKESVIYNNPEKYFTPDFLDLIDKAAGELFKYGGKFDDKVAGGLVESDDEE